MKVATRFLSIRSNATTNPIIETADQFKIQLNSDKFGFIIYKKIGDNDYDLLHSSIPEEFQGKGLGSILGKVRYNGKL